MLDTVLRIIAEASPDALILTGLLAFVVITLLACLLIVMTAILRTKDDQKRELLYKMWRDVLGLFRRQRQS